MTKPSAGFALAKESLSAGAAEIAVLVGASLFVGLCARFSLPLAFTPVPLSLVNFGVLTVGLILGARRGFAVLALYLLEGLIGLPVFSPTGPGGLAQVLGPTGGFLLAYPLAAALAGWVVENGNLTLARMTVAALVGEMVVFMGGISWLAMLTHSLSEAARFGLYWFVSAEIIKIVLAVALARAGRSMLRIPS